MNALGDYIGASREAMGAVRQIVMRRDWERIELAVEMYQESFSRMRNYLQRFAVDEIADAELNDLRQLDIEQRKVMRELGKHMRRTEEDIATLGRGTTL